MDTPRIVLINDFARRLGGAEVIIQRETDFLSERGYDVKTVGFTTEAESEAFVDEVITESPRWYIREFGSVTIAPGIYRKLRAVLADFDPDLVHIHKSVKYTGTVALATRDYPSLKTHHDYTTICPSGWAVKQDNKAACECGVGAKCFQHDCRSLPSVVGYHVPQYKIHRQLERRLVDRHIAPSQRLTEYLREFGYTVSRIPNPERVRDASTVSDEGYFFFIGRLDESKGVDVLIDAIEQVLPELPDCTVKIAGTGPAESRLKSRAADFPDSAVEFLGFVSEDRKKTLLEGARAVVVPSIWMENYPTVVLEAMAHSKPVIGSDRGGIPEMVDHERTGLVYPPTDATALADCLYQLHTHDDVARSMGAAGAEWVETNSNFDLFGEAMLDEIDAVLNG